ncbi:MAG: hypothetical protein ACJAVI_005986 [Candidatus Azotimanducaceae bacterium]|jgi:hypothetical protein
MNSIKSKINVLTARLFKTIMAGASLSMATLLVVAPTNAQGLSDALNMPDELWIGGRIKQGFGVHFDGHSDSSNGWGPSQYVVELQGEWTPNNNITVIGDLWLRGDRFYDLDGGDFRTAALQDFTSPQSGFRDRFSMRTSEDGSLVLPDPFGASGNENKRLDDFDDDILRELSIRITNDEDSLSLKLGKFQRGWGQADGLRLLDILNAQDLRQRTFFADTDEIRIPAWSAALTADLKQLGLAVPFEAMGMKNPTLELIYIAEVRHSEFVVNNPTPNSQTSGGGFGFPFPQLVEGQSGFGMPLLGARLTEREVDDWDNQEVGARLKFGAFGGEATLNAFYGYQDLPVVVNTGSTLHVGSFINDPAASVANVPLDLATTIGAIHAPGQYVDFIQSLAGGTAAPGDFPLIAFGCLDILNPGAGGLPCSVTADFELDYTERQKTIGFSFTRDMSEWKFGRKQVSPVLRLESAYEFDKAFNRGVINDPFIPGQVAAGTPALVGTKTDTVTHRDQISTLIGFDFNFWVPGWTTQQSSIFLTSQFFNIHTKDHENLLFQAPYALLDVKNNQQYFTQTYAIGLFNDRVTLGGLAIWDLSKDAFSYRQRVDFPAFQNKLLTRLEIGTFSGETEGGLLALYENSDYVELSFTYQF